VIHWNLWRYGDGEGVDILFVHYRFSTFLPCTGFDTSPLFRSYTHSPYAAKKYKDSKNNKTQMECGQGSKLVVIYQTIYNR